MGAAIDIAKHSGTSESNDVTIRHSGYFSRWGWEILLVVGLAGVLPLLGSAWFHSFGQPVADDSAYLASLAHLSQHGNFVFNHWGTTTIVGQLLLVAPIYLIFGVHPVLAVLTVWAAGLVGIFGLSFLCRRCGLSRRASAVIVAVVSLCPLFLSLDVTFMTDVPCFSAMILSLCAWTGCRDKARVDRRRWAALAFATLAFSIREPSAIVVVPVLTEPLLAAWRKKDRESLRQMVGIAVGWGLMVGALWLWRQGNPTSGWVPRHWSLLPFLRLWFPGWLPAMLGLFALPVLMKVKVWELLPPLVRRRRNMASLVAFVIVIAPLADIIIWHRSAISPQIGNQFSTDRFMTVDTRSFLYVLGLVSLWASLLVVIGARPSLDKLGQNQERMVRGLSQVMVVYVACMFVLTISGLPTFDRYWLIVITLNAIVLDRSAHALNYPQETSPRRPTTLSEGSADHPDLSGIRWTVHLL